ANSNVIFGTGQHARLGFDRVESALAGDADLLAEQEIENEEKERDGEKTKNGLGEQVRFGADGRLNAGSGKSLLEIGTEIQIDNGAKLHCLFGAGGLFAVITDESPGGLAFLNEQGNREVFVANDLFVIEELDKAVVGDILDILITTVTNEQGHADEAKGNGNKNDAAPVKVRLVIALIIALGIAVRLRHSIWCAEIPRDKSYISGLAMQLAGVTPWVSSTLIRGWRSIGMWICENLADNGQDAGRPTAKMAV